MIAARLLRPRRSTGVAAAGTGLVADLRRPAEFASDDDEHSLIETALIDVLDQSGHGLVIRDRAKLHRLENVVVDRVVVPVLNAATQRTSQTARQNLDARLHQSPREQQLLPPRVASVAVAESRRFPGSGRTPLSFSDS